MTGVDFIYYQEVNSIMIMITTILTITNLIILSSYLYKIIKNSYQTRKMFR